jgi:hypothetical protein
MMKILAPKVAVGKMGAMVEGALIVRQELRSQLRTRFEA